MTDHISANELIQLRKLVITLYQYSMIKHWMFDHGIWAPGNDTPIPYLQNMEYTESAVLQV